MSIIRFINAVAYEGNPQYQINTDILPDEYHQGIYFRPDSEINVEEQTFTLTFVPWSNIESIVGYVPVPQEDEYVSDYPGPEMTDMTQEQWDENYKQHNE